MTQEEKQLLLKDLCARLPYRVKCIVDGLDGCTLMPSDIEEEREIKPYLRSMKDMTEEEEYWYYSFIDRKLYTESASELVDWLLSHHFDFRGLIEKGLAIKVTKENNPY